MEILDELRQPPVVLGLERDLAVWQLEGLAAGDAGTDLRSEAQRAVVSGAACCCTQSSSKSPTLPR